MTQHEHKGVRLRVVAGLLGALLLAGMPAAHANLRRDAIHAGHALGAAGRHIGHAAKRAGLTIGHAAKAGGIAFWHAIKGRNN